MLARFLVRTGENVGASSFEATAVKHGLSEIHEAPGLILRAEPGTVVALGGNDGYIVGRLFTRERDAGKIVQLPSHVASAIVGSKGRHLLEKFWGGYVAFIRKPDLGWLVMRDPSGELPCFYRNLHSGCIMASDATLAGAGGRLSIEWNALGLHLRRIGLSGRRTALSGLAELLPGEQLLVGSESSPEPAWSPWDHICDAETETVDDIASVVDLCCRAWGNSFERICLSLSGGLDSSVLAASLASHAGLTCLNHISPSAAGDERRFAQAVTDQNGLTLAAEPMSTHSVRLDHAASWTMPRPVGRLIGQASDVQIDGILQGAEAAVAVNGEGGDNVFGFIQSPLPALDRLWTEGPGRGFLSSWGDVSKLTDSSYVRSGAWIAKRFCQRGSKTRWPSNDALLASEVVAAADPEPLPDWLMPPRRVKPGKAVHVAGIFQAHARARFLPSGRPTISPLMSQPILEYVLKVPTWRWCQGGIDRAPIRAAFADRLPAIVVRRRWKGGPEGFCLALIAARRSELRARLLDGQLASNGLIDRPAVEESLSEAGIDRGDNYLRILELAEAEAWVEHWSSDR